MFEIGNAGKILAIGAVEVVERDTGKAKPRRKHAKYLATRSGRIRLAMIADNSAASIEAFVNANVKRGATLLTDGHKSFPGLRGYRHDPRVVGKMAAHILLPAYAAAGFFKVFLGRAAEGFAPIEFAMRLSPHDPDFGWWQHEMCHLHAHLAEWDQAIEWCRKSIVTMTMIADTMWPRLDLASALAWTGRADEAKREVAEILKINPNFTLQTFNAIKWTRNSTFNEQIARMGEGLRKAGLPEGKKTD